MIPVPNTRLSPIPVPFLLQLFAWAIGLLVCVAGMLNFVAEWNPAVATLQFLFFASAPVLWMIERRRGPARSEHAEVDAGQRRGLLQAWLYAIAVGVTSFLTCFLVGREIVDLPPAYHDEYSYVFQAKTLLLGRLSVPSHATHPELFDQMHVLNEGQMASRYYPGTGIWLAPWLVLNHPYLGYWLASSLASVFVFWTGYELGRIPVGLVSGLACALSPGVALFSNLLLAHQPTLLALSFFLWAFVRWQRTQLPIDLFLSGCGLSFAMICRPATAAGFGLPFGVAFLYWLLSSSSRNAGSPHSRRIRALLAIGLPLMMGWCVMAVYHKGATGSWTTSPYQLYTEIYTPRHIYGFNNVERGGQIPATKVVEAYDRWAENLTPQLAAQNVRDRLVTSWVWAFDLVPLIVSSLIFCGVIYRLDLRWVAVGLSIVSLHAIHIPYWYVGIMGWHYVFESVLGWCLILGAVTDVLCRQWSVMGRWLLPSWWKAFLCVSILAVYVPLGWIGLPASSAPRVAAGIASIRFPRRQYAEFNRWLDRGVQERPALVLIETDPDNQHVDYVVNSPGLTDPILRGRFRSKSSDVRQIQADFPDRTIYLCDPKRQTLERLR
ncbi:ArnT family glycosyltransferase [Schlesneria sp. T3-172]|uniref:ArnT family glycosyltransferase n=1 Tax=Schlesneria sphaerica TaxID=3373610 RepID=UPI0037C77783